MGKVLLLVLPPLLHATLTIQRSLALAVEEFHLVLDNLLTGFDALGEQVVGIPAGVGLCQDLAGLGEECALVDLG